ncbi:MAG TPA: beta-N-acetylhexosaminidase [Tepidisphaeraceae bacterium]|jgi:hexosaminidase|nr:beta-N-acetylhexosaminidase [Tepidisphaeraceae bacterium]
MTKTILTAVVMVAAGLVGCKSSGMEASMAGPVKVAVIPAPMKVEGESGGGYVLKEGGVIGGDDAGVVKLAAEELHLVEGKKSHAGVKLELGGAEKMLGDEGYEMTVTGRGVVIEAAKPAGLFYGVQTLRQMVGEGDAVAGVHIVDKPRFGYRGLMLDSGRRIQSVEYIKSLIDRMAELKMNRFHWHLTEDQGWRIEIKKYPRLTEFGAWQVKDGKKTGGFFTQEQIKDVVAYAEARFMTVVPEIEMPGHSTAAVASYPWLGCGDAQVAVKPEFGISPHVYCPAKETTYQFCEDVLTEVMGMFPHSPVIHIGGDECPKQEWKTDPACQVLIKKLGLKDEDALQGYFTSRIAHFLADHGRRLQGWNEIMQGTDLPKGVIVQQWNAPQSATQAAEAGLDVVASPTSHCYFDYPYVQIPTHKVLEFEPVPGDLKEELQKHILGPEGELWTDNGYEVDWMAFPRTVAMAEVGWSPKGDKDWEDFRGRCEKWIGRQPEEQRKGLSERLNDGTYFGNRIGGWLPTNAPKELRERKWKGTRYITSAGTYEVRFEYTAGVCGLDIEKVWVEPGGTTDEHSGFTGAAQRDKIYTVTIGKYDPAAVYVVHGMVKGDAGTDSAGVVYIRKVK